MNTVFWNIAVSPEVDQSVRMFIAAQGDRRTELLQRGSIGRTRIFTPATFCAEAL